MTQGDRNRAVTAEVVARAWREPAYLERLRKNTKATLVEAGMTIPDGAEVVLLENTPKIVHAILPIKSDLPRYQAQIDKATKLLADLPEWMEVRILRDSATRHFFVVATPPKTTGELSEADLEAVAGGKGSSGGVVGAISQTPSYGSSTLGVLITGGDISYSVNQVAVIGQVAAVGQLAAVVQVAAAVEAAAAVAVAVVPILVT